MGGGGLDAGRGVGRLPAGGGETPWVPQQGLNPDAGFAIVSPPCDAFPSLSAKWERKPTPLEMVKLVHNTCASHLSQSWHILIA